MDELALIPPGVLLNPAYINELNSWEEFVSFFLQLDEVDNITGWIKADMLLKLSEKYGDSSLASFAKEVNKPASTISNYIRTAKAFSAEKRVAESSFSLHFQASFADSYDEKTGKFLSDMRHAWIEKATDEKLSTRDLKDALKQDKKKKELEVTILPCAYCGKAEEPTYQFIFYSPSLHAPSQKFDLHPPCSKSFVSTLPHAENATKKIR